MIDFESMLAYLQARKERRKFIPSSHKYTIQDCSNLHEIREYSPSEFDTLYFYDIESLYNFTWQCSRCSDIFSSETNITGFKDYIKHFGTQKIYCTECEEEQKRIKEQQKEEQRTAVESAKKKNVSKFISLYLNPETQFIKKLTPYKQFHEIQIEYYRSDALEITEYIKGMNYRDFLKTAYWKAIANYCKYRSKYICSLCYSEKNLIAHHKTYEHHGEEIEYFLTDIICLCDACHSRFHEVKK